MSEFQRLLERERQLAQERAGRRGSPSVPSPKPAASPPSVVKGDATAPHRVETWRESESALDDPSEANAELFGDVRIPSRLLNGVDAARPDPLEADARDVCVAAAGLRKSYFKGQTEIPVLRGVDLEIRSGEFVAIIGQSGCGKSTLLHLLATLDAPDSGEVRLEGKRIDNLPTRARDRLRNEHFGMIFQFYHLLPELTTLENVLAPMMIRQGILRYRMNKRKNVALATELIEMVGLSHRLRHKPRELSGGEMQRTAIARSLMSQPRVLLADEPTGNLDHATGQEILHILRTLNRDRNLTIVMVTHDLSIARQADRIVRLAEGRVVSG